MSDTYDVKNGVIASRMRDIGQRIHSALDESELKGKMGFALLLFDFGVGGSMFYISDANREDMLKAMKEFIAKQEDAKKNQ